MSVEQQLNELRTTSPGAATIAWEIRQVEEAFAQNQISAEERAYLLNEIKDIKAANLLANEENAMRVVVAAVTTLLAVM